MTRILVISNMYPSPRHPAFGVFVRDRVEAFARRGVEVQTVANTDPSKGLLRTSVKYSRLLVRALASAIRHRPDIIEGHYLLPTAVVAAAAAVAVSRPFALYVHGSDAALPARKLVERALRWAVSRAATIQTNSEWTANLIADRFGRRPRVIPPGVDTTVFKPPQTDARRAGVGYAGGLVPHKGVDVLLRAVALLSDHTVPVTIAGDGPERTTLVSLAKELGISDRVTWLGEVDRPAVAEAFRKVRVVAVPSRRDAFGLVAVEGLACGTPVVASDVGGLGSILTPTCGTAVPPGDAQALAAALEHWLDASNNASTRAATERAATERAASYAIDNVAGDALADLNEAIRTRR